MLQDYINKLTHLLLAAEGDAGGAAVEQIRELVESQRWAVQCYGKSDMSKLMKISMDVRREGSPRFTSVDAARKLMVQQPTLLLYLPCLSFRAACHLVPASSRLCGSAIQPVVRCTVAPHGCGTQQYLCICVAAQLSSLHAFLFCGSRFRASSLLVGRNQYLTPITPTTKPVEGLRVACHA